MRGRFGDLLEPEIPKLRRYARALTRDATRADDLVQGCLLRALEKSHLWQRGTDLRAWLCTILHNQYINDLRRAAQRGPTLPMEYAEPVAMVVPEQGASLLLRDLERAVARLPEEHRCVLLLVGLEGMRYDDVAAVLGIPIGTVRSRLSRGRALLRGMMGMDMQVKRGAPGESSRAPQPDGPRAPVARHDDALRQVKAKFAELAESAPGPRIDGVGCAVSPAARSDSRRMRCSEPPP